MREKEENKLGDEETLRMKIKLFGDELTRIHKEQTKDLLLSYPDNLGIKEKYEKLLNDMPVEYLVHFFLEYFGEAHITEMFRECNPEFIKDFLKKILKGEGLSDSEVECDDECLE